MAGRRRWRRARFDGASLVNLEIAHRWERSVPYATATVNLVGSFSSFMLDTFTLGHGGHHLAASLNVLAQNAVGLALVWAGYTVAARLHW